MRPIFLTRTQRLGILLRDAIGIVGAIVGGLAAGAFIASIVAGLLHLIGVPL